MFNYIRSDKLVKKPKAPMSPIEKEVNMPIEMQKIPQPDPDTTCIYPDMNIPPTMPSPPSTPMQPPSMPMLPQPMPLPCAQCPHCIHYDNCMGQTPPPLPLPTPALPAPDASCDKSKNQDDMEVAYIKKMYPPLCQKIQKYIESELQQYDHDLSPIYEMYPSKDTINHMANCIYTDMKATMGGLIKEFEGNSSSRSPIGGSFYTLIYALLLNELYRKRMRKRLYR